VAIRQVPQDYLKILPGLQENVRSNTSFRLKKLIERPQPPSGLVTEWHGSCIYLTYTVTLKNPKPRYTFDSFVVGSFNEPSPCGPLKPLSNDTSLTTRYFCGEHRFLVSSLDAGHRQPPEDSKWQENHASEKFSQRLH